MALERRLARALVERHPEDAGRRLEALAPEDAVATLARLRPETAALALRHVEPSFAAACLGSGEPGPLGSAIDLLPPETLARIAGRMEPGPAERLLASLSRERAEPVRLLMRQPEGTAGALMDAGVPSIPEDLSAGEARRGLRRLGGRVLYYLYVTDREQRLVGVLNLRELMLAPAHRAVADLMKRPAVSLSVHAGRDAILAHPGWHEFHALPVVDGNGVLLGVLRYETLRRIESETAVPGVRTPLELGLGLGEIYLMAAAAVLQGALEAAGSLAGRAARDEEKRDDG